MSGGAIFVLAWIVACVTGSFFYNYGKRMAFRLIRQHVDAGMSAHDALDYEEARNGQRQG